MNLVTGATGLVGANLVRELLSRGEKVRVLVRSDTRGVDGLDVEKAPGDIVNYDEVREAMRGCKRVFHAAAFVSIRSCDSERLHQINVGGTENLLRAALEEGVERFVHCSSFGTIGNSPTGGPCNESMILDPATVELPYEVSKVMAEYAVMKYALQGLDAVMVNPTGIIGPYDFKPSAVGGMVESFCNGKMPAYMDGVSDYVAAKDVAKGMILAAERGKKGERYILSSEPASVEDIFRWLHEFTGLPMPKIKIPLAPLLFFTAIQDWLQERFFPNYYPQITNGVLKYINTGRRADASKAKAELGWEPMPAKQAVLDCLMWEKDMGWLPANTPINSQIPV